MSPHLQLYSMAMTVVSLSVVPCCIAAGMFAVNVFKEHIGQTPVQLSYGCQFAIFVVIYFLINSLMCERNPKGL